MPVWHTGMWIQTASADLLCSAVYVLTSVWLYDALKCKWSNNLCCVIQYNIIHMHKPLHRLTCAVLTKHCIKDADEPINRPFTVVLYLQCKIISTSILTLVISRSLIIISTHVVILKVPAMMLDNYFKLNVILRQMGVCDLADLLIYFFLQIINRVERLEIISFSKINQ